MDDLLRSLGALPCGRRLLEAADGIAGVHLVGGAVRDLLLGREPRELDVVVEGDVDALAQRLGGAAAAHERFGTATVQAGGCRWDLAAARAEAYARPGALPDVRAAGIDEDLRRRDVTVHALALDLATGELRGAPGAVEDLRAGRLRVLHERSFIDDPTRLWRVARYAARLSFTLEEATERLAREAVAAGALGTVSGARIGNELRLALREPDPVAALATAADLGLTPWPAPDGGRVAAALALLPEGEGRADLVALAVAMSGASGAAEDAPGAAGGGSGAGAEDLARMDFTAAELAVVAACLRAPGLAAAAGAASRPSELAAVLAGQPVEAVALAGAHGATDPARRWLQELRHVRLAITGDDLIAAGVPRGPDVGRRLAATLARRMDGELAPGRDAELAAALA